MVIGIMALLGSLTVGGYRAMQRGIEERGVMENVNHFIRSAYRRAQIDRQPVAVFFWNETLREETDDEPIIVVGKAVAVRRSGRVSRFSDPYLYDEFSDLDRERLIVDKDDWETGDQESGLTKGDNLIPIYKMNSRSSYGRSLVSQSTKDMTQFNSDTILSEMRQRQISCWAYVLADRGTVDSWHTGDAYGFECGEIELPRGYLFRNSYKRRPEDKLSSGDYTVMWFDVSLNTGSGSDEGATSVSTIEVFSMRPNDAGTLEPVSVATSEKPTEGIH